MVLKQNDIRIGNWVNDGYEDRKVRIDDFANECIFFPETPMQKWSPIKLTEEWLERFGFKKEKHGNVMRIKVGSGAMLDDDVYELCWHKGNTWLEIFQDYHTHSMSLPDTLFVHEMQNLFKPLTGHELNLNEL